MVGKERLELSRTFVHMILNHARLPIPTLPRAAEESAPGKTGCKGPEWENQILHSQNESISSRFLQGQGFGPSAQNHPGPGGATSGKAIRTPSPARADIEKTPAPTDLAAESASYFVPVNRVEPRAHVVRPLVLVVEIVGVLPDINSEDRHPGTIH